MAKILQLESWRDQCPSKIIRRTATYRRPGWIHNIWTSLVVRQARVAIEMLVLAYPASCSESRHGWLVKFSLAAPPTPRRCTRCMHNKMSNRIPATPQALNKRPKSFQSNVHPKAVVPLNSRSEGAIEVLDILEPTAVDSAAEIGLADARIVGEDRRGSGQGNHPGFQHKGAAGDFQRHGGILLNQQYAEAGTFVEFDDAIEHLLDHDRCEA